MKVRKSHIYIVLGLWVLLTFVPVLVMSAELENNKGNAFRPGPPALGNYADKAMPYKDLQRVKMLQTKQSYEQYCS